MAQFFSFGVRAEPTAPAGCKCVDRRKQPCPLAELLCIFLCAVVLVPLWDPVPSQSEQPFLFVLGDPDVLDRVGRQ